MGCQYCSCDYKDTLPDAYNTQWRSCMVSLMPSLMSSKIWQRLYQHHCISGKLLWQTLQLNSTNGHIHLTGHCQPALVGPTSSSAPSDPWTPPEFLNMSIYFIIPERLRCQMRALNWSFPKRHHSDFLPTLPPTGSEEDGVFNLEPIFNISMLVCEFWRLSCPLFAQSVGTILIQNVPLQKARNGGNPQG